MHTVTEETFLQVCGCAWDHLGPARTTVRATCRRGRTLHDRLLTQLKPSLQPTAQTVMCSPSKPTAAAVARPLPPTVDELRRLVAGLQYRGSRLQSLATCFSPPQPSFMYGEDDDPELPPPHQREKQLLAMLEGCHGCPINTLQLEGGIPHTMAVAKAVADCCPHLTKLDLNYDFETNDLPSASGGKEARREYTDGVVSLLQLVGPRLRELRVMGSAHRWARKCFDALSHCTALTSLAAHVGWMGVNDEGERVPVGPIGSAAAEARLLSAVCSLSQLRSLSFVTILKTAACSPDALRPHATSLAQLCALTALTRLELCLSDCYEPAGDSWRRQQLDGNQREAWEQVREVHRASLLSALGCMPQLQHLHCHTLWLRPSDLASLTALTRITLGGLLPPTAAPVQVPAAVDASASSAAAAGAAAAAAAARPSTAAGALPPQLQSLILAKAASPSALAALQPAPNLKHITLYRIRLGTSDVSPDGRVLPTVAADVGLAARLLAPFVESSELDDLTVAADCGPRPMGPPEAGLQGHTGWIRELAAVSALERLHISDVQLHVGDLTSLVSVLPDLKSLALTDTHVAPTALYALTGLQQLEELRLDLTHCTHLTTDELAALLCLLCRGIQTLASVSVDTKSSEVDLLACRTLVWGQLAAWGSRRLPGIHLVDTGDEEQAEEEEEDEVDVQAW